MFARSVVLSYAKRYAPLLILALLLLPWRIYLAGKVQKNATQIVRISSPFGAGSALHSITMLSPTNIWAVGGTFVYQCKKGDPTCFATPTSGTILHETNNTWFVAGNAPEPLLGVSLDSPSDGWAVGYTGTFLHYDGTVWSLVPGPRNFNQSLFGIVMLSSSDGWVVGNSGSILHYDGRQWAVVVSPVTLDLRSIAMPSAQEGWAVGVNGTILHYLHGTWHVALSPTRNTLNNITMLSPSEGWAVGERDTILHYRSEDGQWVNVYHDPSIDQSAKLYGVALSSVRSGWTIGTHQLLTYSAEAWLDATNMPIQNAKKTIQNSNPAFSTLNLYSIVQSNVGEAWAVGSTDNGGPNTMIILHYAGGTWSVSFTAT